jgi:rubrerythrin
MENKSENKEEKITNQQELVKKLAKEYKNSPSDELKNNLDRETDTLRHLSNAAKKYPKERAQKAAEFAKRTALNRAVQQVS